MIKYTSEIDMDVVTIQRKKLQKLRRTLKEYKQMNNSLYKENERLLKVINDKNETIRKAQKLMKLKKLWF